MLLDSGATALLEGFTLEACASFAAALERFLRVWIWVAFVGRNMPDDLFDGMFSEMSRQSERQLGAFLLLHALDFGSAYKPKPSIAAFRNDVIHKGVIPTAEKARKFCSEVYEVIYSLYGTISTKYGNSIQSVVGKELAKRRTKLLNDMRVSTSGGFNLFSIANASNFSSFVDALASFKEAREGIRDSIPAMMALHKAQQPQA